MKIYQQQYHMEQVVGIANGDWDKVYKIIEKVFNNHDVTLYRLEDNKSRWK